MIEVARLVNIDALKAEIVEDLPISAVAERLCDTALEPSGAQMRGCCPLHDERTPSFYTNDAKNAFHCFGCKAGGDAIALVQQVRHLSFHEALYLLAAEADIDIGKYERPMTEAEAQRERLRAGCEAYLGTVDATQLTRGADAAKAFGVGVTKLGDVPDVPEWMTSRGKVLFPYRMPSGRLLGWKLREGPGEEKWMRATPRDFPLGNMAETLFGIHIAREHVGDGDLLVVEGEYDVLACHANGITNVVAMGGSAFTDEHMKLLESLHISRLCFVFDGDEGGRKAAAALASRFWQHPVQVRICHMPEHHDPESFLAEFADISFVVHTYGARHALEYLLWEEWNRQERSSLSAKLDFVSWIQRQYGAQLTSTKASLVFAEVAHWLDIPVIDVQDFVRTTEAQLQAVDSERVVLGRAMRDQRYYVEARKLLTADDFFLMKHQRLWAVLEQMVAQNLDADLAVAQKLAQLQAIDPAYVAEIAQVGDSNIAFHEQQIADLALRRRARDDAMAFKTQVADLSQPSDQIIGQFTHAITAKVLKRDGGQLRAINEQVDQAMEVLHDRMKNPTEIHGLDLGTQLPQLSRGLQGLQPRRLVVIAANSRRGKSTMAAQFAVALSVGQAVPTDFISLEMDEVELLFKMASHLTQINSMLISGGALNDGQAKAVEQAMLRIRKSPLRIYAPDDLCPSEFLLYAREQRMQRRSEVFFVDYVQLVSPEHGSERLSKYDQIGQFSRSAKMQVARAMDCTVVVCAQMRREAADKERPTAEDVGDSYQIVRDADVFLIIQGQEDSSTSEIWLDKNRQGAGNLLIPAFYNMETQTFSEASGGERTPGYAVPVA